MTIFPASDDNIRPGSRGICQPPCSDLLLNTRFSPEHEMITGSGFQIIIAITIAIKNYSGKIGDRFSFRNRSAISGSKSISEFHFEIDQRLKTGLSGNNTDGAINRDPIFVRKSISDFEIKIDLRFLFSNRSAIFIYKSQS